MMGPTLPFNKILGTSYTVRETVTKFWTVIKPDEMKTLRVDLAPCPGQKFDMNVDARSVCGT